MRCHDYEISVTTTSVVFKVDGVVAGTFTTNIPTGVLNVYVSSDDGGGVGMCRQHRKPFADSYRQPSANISPSITTPPTSVTVNVTSNATFSLTGNGYATALLPVAGFHRQRANWSDLANGRRL